MAFNGTNGDLSLGFDSVDDFHSGDVGELVIYTGDLTAAEHERIQSYLAVKYGITLDANFVHSGGTTIWDATANAAYHNAVTGIGRDDSSVLDQRKSKSVNSDALVTIEHAAAFVADRSLLMWGNNNATKDFVVSAGFNQRMGRVWKVQETNSIGAVTVSIPSGTNATKLLVDDDGDFSTGAVEFPLTLAGGALSANVNFNNGQLFSFAGAPVVDIVVTTAVDENNGTHDPSQGTGTSLREAIIAANSDPNASTITFAPALNGTPMVLDIGSSNENASLDGDLDITTDVTIQGNGATKTIMDAGGVGALDERVLEVHVNATLTLDGVKVTGGNAAAVGPSNGTGGGLRNIGTTTVINSDISGNSIVPSNFANPFGGGIFNFGNLTVVNSTISNNMLANANISGGGISNSATLTIVNSTISGNRAEDQGGAILNYATATIINSTISNNTAADGGGINTRGTGTTMLNNTIVAGSNAGGDLSTSDSGAYAGTNNLIQDGSGTGLSNPVAGNPMPGPLQNNGGPTETHALGTGSAAIDAGSNANATVDGMVGSTGVDDRPARIRSSHRGWDR